MRDKTRIFMLLIIYYIEKERKKKKDKKRREKKRSVKTPQNPHPKPQKEGFIHFPTFSNLQNLSLSLHSNGDNGLPSLTTESHHSIGAGPNWNLGPMQELRERLGLPGEEAGLGGLRPGHARGLDSPQRPPKG